MRVTAKGQVTIPVAIRQKLGLLPGTEVALEVDGDAVRVRRAREARDRRGEALVRRLHGRAGAGTTTDEILARTREP